jgi:MerR family transcriptional regulator/heat shock protein HspR
VEIILNMREKMAAMQRQMEEFVSTLNREMAERAVRQERRPETSLIPVVRAVPPVAPKGAGRRRRA